MKPEFSAIKKSFASHLLIYSLLNMRMSQKFNDICILPRSLNKLQGLEGIELISSFLRLLVVPIHVSLPTFKTLQQPRFFKKLESNLAM